MSFETFHHFSFIGYMWSIKCIVSKKIKTNQINQRSQSRSMTARSDNPGSGGGLMAIAWITFSKLFYWKKPPLSVRLSLLWKESVLSHRALNRGVLCGHTRLGWAVSRCETFEPSALWRTVGFCLRLICSRGWKRFNGGRPLHRVGLWSFSKELFFFFFIQGRGHHYWGLRERKGAQRSGDFLLETGISVFDVGSCVPIWQSWHQSGVVSFSTASFWNSSRKLKKPLRLFICGLSSFGRTISPNRLFGFIMSHKPIFLLAAANRNDFIFLHCRCLIFHWGCIRRFKSNDVKELVAVFPDNWLSFVCKICKMKRILWHE